MPPDRDLDRELRDLGLRIENPPVPDLARSVRGRLETEAGGPGYPTRARPQLWWIAAAALVLLVAVPVVSLAIRGTGAGGGAAGGVAVESGGQEAEDAAGPTRLTEDDERGPTHPVGEDESLTAGASQEAKEESETQESIIDGGDAAGQTGRPNGPVPDVVGMGLTAACEKLSAREYVGYVIRTVDDPGSRPGRVVEQRPLPGRNGYTGGPVDLTVSEPYPEDELQRLSRGRNPACLDATG